MATSDGTVAQVRTHGGDVPRSHDHLALLARHHVLGQADVVEDHWRHRRKEVADLQPIVLTTMQCKITFRNVHNPSIPLRSPYVNEPGKDKGERAEEVDQARVDERTERPRLPAEVTASKRGRHGKGDPQRRQHDERAQWDRHDVQ